MWGENALINAKNVIPGRLGFRPLRAYDPLTSAMGSARARGAKSFRRDNSSLTTLAGNKTGLYKFNIAKTWDDITDSAYSLDDDQFWSMTQFGSLAIMTSLAHNIKKYDIVTAPATVSDLGGSPPRARHVITVNDNVCLGGIEDYPARIQWSDANNAENWSSGDADYQDFPEGGRVMCGLGGRIGYWFQERMIRAMNYAPGSPQIYQIVPVDESRGSATYRGLVGVGSSGFYLSNDGFMRFDSGKSTPIGFDKVDDWFYSVANGSYISRTVGGYDPKKKLVYWAFMSLENSAASAEVAMCDKILIHHWPTGRWAWAQVNVSTFLDMVYPVGTTLEDIADIDAMTSSSLDAIVLNADSISSELAMFGDDYKLGFFSGSNMEALFEYERLQFFAPSRQYFVGLSPVVDGAGLQAAVAPRESYEAAESFTEYVTQESNGFIPVDNSAKMHDLRIKIPASTTWNHTRGFFAEVQPDGDL